MIILGKAALNNRDLCVSSAGDEAEGLATEQRLSRWLCHLQGLGIAVGPVLPSYCQVTH